MSARFRPWAELCVFLLLWAVLLPAHAARVFIVLSGDSAPYLELAQAAAAQLEQAGHETQTVQHTAMPRLEGNHVAVLAVGTAAAEGAATLPLRVPVVATLVPRGWYGRSLLARQAEAGRRQASAVYLDQPFDRQARLIRLTLPEARRVGVLVSPAQRELLPEVEAALAAYQLQLQASVLGAGERLSSSLASLLAEVDVLLLVPDPEIVNPGTIQSLILTAYRHRDPVVGYSASLTRAGALMSLHTQPAQIGRQAAEMLSEGLRWGAPRLAAPAFPVAAEVSTNDRVARSLSLAIPPASEIERQLAGRR